MSKLLSKDDIFKAPDLKTETIEVPEWKGTVRVSQITAADRLALQAMVLDEKGNLKDTVELNKVMTLALVAFAVVNEQGERIFTDAEIAELGKKSGTAISRIYEVADRLNGISQGQANTIKKN